MRKKTARKESPLLFQHKPIVKENMQTTFSAKKAQRVKQKQREEMERTAMLESKKEKISEKDSAIGMIETPAAVRDQIHEYHVEQAEQQETPVRQPAFRKLKSFRDMDVEEKLIYLFNFPKQLPPVACIVTVADGQQFRGFIIGKADKTVTVKLMDGEEISLFTKKIIEVKMVGM
ncbi:CotO family spore coat protein [Niallia taxi]|uniref:CotO family spore coat protein n=1 Tax=Niallia taxi TaxID=2499688 RepID=UPI0011A73D27|nr:CotO family spore coat protein [Niallia taxi]MCT2342771.1 spore coat CotO family protein [Niallia taxi]MDE5051024.1 CotO family spore coat protein [Niallia taxi]MED3962452.1 CotO family spore coat protein [Niallia taxi]